MNVGDRMTRNPFTVKKETTAPEARELMKREKIHRLPVIDDKGHLLGVITEKDILYAWPSPASTLDVWEVSTLLSRLKVGEIMTPNPMTCAPSMPVEEAARILSENKIGGLPVVEDGVLTGIITESDLFKIFIELFSSRDRGLRLTALIPDVHGELASLAAGIRDAGGDFISAGFVRGDKPTNRLCVAKIAGLSEEELRKTIEPLVLEIKEIREI